MSNFKNAGRVIGTGKTHEGNPVGIVVGENGGGYEIFRIVHCWAPNGISTIKNAPTFSTLQEAREYVLNL